MSACCASCLGLGIGLGAAVDLKMEGRDSSLAAAGEDDGISPVTDGLAKEAEALFSDGRYSDCIEVLNQLLAKKEGDPKVSFLIW